MEKNQIVKRRIDSDKAIMPEEIEVVKDSKIVGIKVAEVKGSEVVGTGVKEVKDSNEVGIKVEKKEPKEVKIEVGKKEPKEVKIKVEEIEKEVVEELDVEDEDEEYEGIGSALNFNIEKEDSKSNQAPPPSLLRELAGLGIKIAIIAIVLIMTFTFVFGLHRNLDGDMFPMVKSGDLVMYYRLDKDYSIGDLLLLNFNGETQVRRVIAKEGDVVDIDEQGLKINDSWQQEINIYQETWQYEEGIEFPITIRPGQLFVLGDARENATDSRIYGPVDAKDTLGTVVSIIRQRNF